MRKIVDHKKKHNSISVVSCPKLTIHPQLKVKQIAQSSVLMERGSFTLVLSFK